MPHSHTEMKRSKDHSGAVHYGQNHAETVARAKLHRNEAVAQSSKPDTMPEVASAPAKGQPIGSTPGSERPWTDDFKGLWSEIQGSVELMGGALHDFKLGTSRLLRVPRDAARLARARLRA